MYRDEVLLILINFRFTAYLLMADPIVTLRVVLKEELDEDQGRLTLCDPYNAATQTQRINERSSPLRYTSFQGSAHSQSPRSGISEQSMR